MRVGLLTYHWVGNMGANLQALSTYCYLKNHGFDPIIVNWQPSDVEQYYIKNVSANQMVAHRNFANTHFSNCTNLCRNSEQIAKELIKHDIHFVCIGSDAVFSTKPFLSRWHLGRRGFTYNKPYSDGVIENPFWGEFVDMLPTNYKIEIVALSASAQNSPYKRIIFAEERNKYLNALKRFSKITVRDIWTRQMCEYVSRQSICPKITPDPVFGFNYNVNPPRLNYVESKLKVGTPYVLLSVSSTVKDDEWIKEVERGFYKHGITVVGLPKTNVPYKKVLKYNIEFPLDPMEWYDAIKYSQGYVGELMHPVLVALHNSVPVYAFDTYGYRHLFKFDEQSSKTFQILKRFNLLNNYYNSLYNSIPTPKTVVDTILATNIAAIAKTSNEMLDAYKKTMQYLLPQL